jgi:hypothetical protein
MGFNSGLKWLNTVARAGSIYFCREIVTTKQLKVLLKAINLLSAFLFTSL